jgi:threonine/homoserine/homoserine lactone efflux protein
VKAVIGDILPLLIIVAVSPLNIVAAILLLFSKKPIANASSYLGGFVLGVAMVLTALIAMADAIGLNPDSGRSRGASVLLLVLGVSLIVLAIRKFSHRPPSTEQPVPPKWMQGIDAFGTGKSFVVGLSVGSLNPKNIAVAVASGVLIATAELPGTQQILVVIVYTLIVSLGVGAPILTAVALGDRSEDVLSAWRDWLNRNNATMMAVIYLFFGVILLGKGIAGT